MHGLLIQFWVTVLAASAFFLVHCASTNAANREQLKLALIVATSEHPRSTRAVVAFLDAVGARGNISEQLKVAREHDPDNAWAYVLAANYLGSYADEAVRDEARKLADELRIAK